ncbi:hypothetical protein HK101_010670 [Irineochytrium annulatum]|nr:hypothetical protein HK101_010670 [Irineochytrium annulatum]
MSIRDIKESKKRYIALMGVDAAAQGHPGPGRGGGSGWRGRGAAGGGRGRGRGGFNAARAFERPAGIESLTRSTLQLVFSDGFTDVVGVEKERLAFLNFATPLGYKVRVKGAKVLRGRMMLSPKECFPLGGATVVESDADRYPNEEKSGLADLPFERADRNETIPLSHIAPIPNQNDIANQNPNPLAPQPAPERVNTNTNPPTANRNTSNNNKNISHVNNNYINLNLNNHRNANANPNDQNHNHNAPQHQYHHNNNANQHQEHHGNQNHNANPPHPHRPPLNPLNPHHLDHRDQQPPKDVDNRFKKPATPAHPVVPKPADRDASVGPMFRSPAHPLGHGVAPQPVARGYDADFDDAFGDDDDEELLRMMDDPGLEGRFLEEMRLSQGDADGRADTRSRMAEDDEVEVLMRGIDGGIEMDVVGGMGRAGDGIVAIDDDDDDDLTQGGPVEDLTQGRFLKLSAPVPVGSPSSVKGREKSEKRPLETKSRAADDDDDVICLDSPSPEPRRKAKALKVEIEPEILASIQLTYLSTVRGLRSKTIFTKAYLGEIHPDPSTHVLSGPIDDGTAVLECQIGDSLIRRLASGLPLRNPIAVRARVQEELFKVDAALEIEFDPDGIPSVKDIHPMSMEIAERILNAQKAQRITSPIVKAVVYHLRHDPLIERELGTDIAIDKNSGVNGYVDHYKGKADVSFRVKGSAGEADVTYAGQRLRTDVWRSDVFRLKLVGKKENGNGNAGAKGMLDLL